MAKTFSWRMVTSGELGFTPSPCIVEARHSPGTERSTRATGSSARAGTCISRRSVRSRQLEPDDTRDDQGEAQDPQRTGRLGQQDHAENGCAHRSDADPYGIGGPDRQGLHGHAKQPEADRHAQYGARGWPKPGEAVGIFEPDRPT